jgi:hypothetical protein
VRNSGYTLAERKKLQKRRESTMQRRDFVKAFMAATVAAKAALGQQAAPPSTAAQQASIAPRAPVAPGPVPWMEGLKEMGPLPVTPLVPDAVAETQAHFFTPVQRATMRRFCEILMPPMRGNPGAVEAGTPEFLDFLIGASPAEKQTVYRSGLDRLEAEARHEFGLTFADVSAAQAGKIIRPWLRTWMPDHPPTEGFAHFINIAHSEIRFATANSQLWNDMRTAAGLPPPESDVYWYPVDPDLRRHPLEPARAAAPAAQHG